MPPWFNIAKLGTLVYYSPKIIIQIDGSWITKRNEEMLLGSMLLVVGEYGIKGVPPYGQHPL